MLNDEQFPDFTQVKNMKKQKRNVNNTSSKCSTPTPSSSISSETNKYYICKSILYGGACQYGHKCKYAHYEDEWCIQNCSRGTKCNRVKGDKCKNVDPKNMCLFIHPHEDFGMFYNRLKVKKENIIRPSNEEMEKLKHFSKMCDSYFLEAKCNKAEGECKYAHNKEQLIIRECMFKDKCNFIICEKGVYSTNGSIDCIYIHPSETYENYENRVFEPRKKFVVKQQLEKEKLEKEKAIKMEYVASLPPLIASSQKIIFEFNNDDEEDQSESWGDIMTKDEDKHEKENLVVNEDKLVEEIKPVEKQDRIIIETTEAMATSILQIMLNSGHTNFELKIVKV